MTAATASGRCWTTAATARTTAATASGRCWTTAATASSHCCSDNVNADVVARRGAAAAVARRTATTGAAKKTATAAGVAKKSRVKVAVDNTPSLTSVASSTADSLQQLAVSVSCSLEIGADVECTTSADGAPPTVKLGK